MYGNRAGRFCRFPFSDFFRDRKVCLSVKEEDEKREFQRSSFPQQRKKTQWAGITFEIRRKSEIFLEFFADRDKIPGRDTSFHVIYRVKFILRTKDPKRRRVILRILLVIETISMQFWKLWLQCQLATLGHVPPTNSKTVLDFLASLPRWASRSNFVGKAETKFLFSPDSWREKI